MKAKILQLLEDKRELLLRFNDTGNVDFDRLIRDEIEDIDYDIEEYSTKNINQQCSEEKIIKLEKQIKNDYVIHQLGWVQFSTWLKRVRLLDRVEVNYRKRKYQISYSVNKYEQSHGVKEFEFLHDYLYKGLISTLKGLDEVIKRERECAKKFNENRKNYIPNMDEFTAIISLSELDRHGVPSKWTLEIKELEKMPHLAKMVGEKDIKDIDMSIVRGGGVLLINAMGRVTSTNLKAKLLKSISGYYGNEFQRGWLEKFINNLK